MKNRTALALLSACLLVSFQTQSAIAENDDRPNQQTRPQTADEARRAAELARDAAAARSTALENSYAPDDGYALHCPQPDESRFSSGRLHRRECTLGNIREAGIHYNYSWMVYSAGILNQFYERRADRQQRFMDVGAAITWTGAVGAALSGRVGVPTQRAWVGLGFVPVLLSQQNSWSPTRDLYHAGAIALQLISGRYATLQRRAVELSALGDNLDKRRPDCRPAEQALTVATGWALGDDRNAVLPEAQRLTDACHNVSDAMDEYGIFRTQAEQESRTWTYDFALDVLALDEMLLDKDRHFRYSPSQTLGLMLAAPLRSLDTIISGQNPDEALKKLQADAAFSDMNRMLQEVALPPLPRDIPVIDGVSSDARARAIATERPAPDDGQRAPPSASDVRDVVDALDRVARASQLARTAQLARAQMVTDLNNAAHLRSLSFDFNTTTAVVTVGLAPPLTQAPREERTTEGDGSRPDTNSGPGDQGASQSTPPADGAQERN